MDALIAEFFYENSVAFNAASTQSYKKLWEKIRPGYKPPNAENLAGPLLDASSANADSELDAMVKSKKSPYCISQDGWSGTSQEPIIGSSACVQGQTFLISIVNAGIEHKTADFCAEKARQTIADLEERFGRKVI
jgi:hypothetical protein